jgi:hypothetical protein
MSAMNIYTIYRAINKVNGKSYIGFDSNWPNRKRDHRRYHPKDSKYAQSSAFYKALRKYSWDNFEWEILYQSYEFNHTKNVMENYFICEYRTYTRFDDCNGYNMTLGGDGITGYSYSEKQKEANRQRTSERFSCKEVRDKHSEIMINWSKSRTEEQKKITSEKLSLTVKSKTEEQKKITSEKLSKSLKGLKRSEETRQKISKGKKGKKQTKEHAEKAAASRKANGVNIGERNGMANPDNRKKIAASKIGRKKYINPISNIGKYCFPGTEPEGFILAKEYKLA